MRARARWSYLYLTYQIEEQPLIVKKRQDGTRATEVNRLRHWGCGPYCHTAYVKEPDEVVPAYEELNNRNQNYLMVGRM